MPNKKNHYFLYVSEIFESIQGEGKNAGRASIFLRTAFCNLNCIWCDTKYSWKKPVEFQKMRIDRIVEIINKSITKNIVITGGEPLLWQNSFERIFKNIKDKNIEVETNGTVLPEKSFDRYVHQYNVSPKLKNSKVPKTKRIKEDVLQWFANSNKAYFKYVIQKAEDIDEVLWYIEKFSIKKDRIYLMPEGDIIKKLIEKREMVASLSIKHNLNYTDRLHIILWNGKRGK